MTSANTSSVLKDVIAYVDVWSSDKTANYSKPFVQQLQEMGAQVSKTFNKQVTHVVFNNGHSATWRKAKKSKVRLVSVLWVGRCYDDCERVDEELFPALNDESNPLLKNKKHRCMQPKDSPVRTPENDTRMRKKLDRMMKDLAPKEPLVTDVSPVIIDEENGIVYSPALKRSAYMAQRLKDMKEKHENLSPTASQMVESCSPSGLKPSIGSTPTVSKLMFDQSDDDSSASVAEPGYSPDKEEGRTQAEVSAHDHPERCHRKTFETPCLSPSHSVPTWITSPLKCPDFKEKDEKGRKKSRRTSVRKQPEEKHKSVGLLESPWQDKGTDNSKYLHKERKRSQVKSLSLSTSKSEKGKQKVKAALSCREIKSHFSADVNTSSHLCSPDKLGDAAVKPPSETFTPQQKTPEQGRSSFSSLVQSFTVSSDLKPTPSCSTDGDDNVFEDYYSPANFKQKSKCILPNLPLESDLHIPFDLGPVPKKRKQRNSERMGFEGSSKKKKLEESKISENVKNLNRQSEARLEPPPQQDVKESVAVLKDPRADLPLTAKRRRQSKLPFTITSTTTSVSVKKRRASTLAQPAVSDLSHTLESRGNECTVAAGSTEIPSEGEGFPKEQVGLGVQKIVSKTKTMRTLVMTSLPTEKQHVVGQVVMALGGFSVVDQVCESTTHVVSGGQRRTLNILLGIARGCWILSFEWILWSLEQRQWIPEEPYELSDHFPAAQICRLQRHLSAGEHRQDLFQGQPVMFVSQHSQPPTQSLVELIQLCGGTVCKTVRQAGICIGKCNGRKPEGTRVLSEQWVLDSITHLKLLSFDNYDLE